MNTSFFKNRLIVVKQCPNEGECVESYSREVKQLIDSRMLVGKSDEIKFYLLMSQNYSLIGTVPEHLKAFGRLV